MPSHDLSQVVWRASARVEWRVTISSFARLDAHKFWLSPHASCWINIRSIAQRRHSPSDPSLTLAG